MTQLRIDFPDYPAKEQERDVKRFEKRQKKDVYIVKVRGTYGAYLPRESLPISVNSDNGDDLTSFYSKAKDFFENELNINPKFHCVLNHGIEEHILKQIQIQKLIEK